MYKGGRIKNTKQDTAKFLHDLESTLKLWRSPQSYSLNTLSTSVSPTIIRVKKITDIKENIASAIEKPDRQAIAVVLEELNPVHTANGITNNKRIRQNIKKIQNLKLLEKVAFNLFETHCFGSKGYVCWFCASMIYLLLLKAFLQRLLKPFEILKKQIK